jgi:AraC family transcriptional activator of pobA
MDRSAKNLDISSMSSAGIPQFYLYGEPPIDAAARFLHLEGLAERSRPNNWNIRPHAHRDLHHLFHITDGAGRVSFDGVETTLVAPFLLLAPAGVAHAFVWDEDTDGKVLTLADSYLRDLAGRAPALAGLFEQAAWLEMGAADAAATGLSEALTRLSHEAAWNAPGHDAAVEAHLLIILVAALRLASGGQGRNPPSPQAQLVARFRDAVERRFRASLSVGDYAADLAVSEKQLRAACLKIAGRSPLQLVRQRTALEARRLLTYSNMSVAEVGYSLGFADPAYFSRFFALDAGCSPRAFRERPA